MCSQGDFPPYDPPETTTVQPVGPRRIVTAGDRVPRGSVALAVLGTMLTEAEKDRAGINADRMPFLADYADARIQVLREARDAVAEAEAR